MSFQLTYMLVEDDGWWRNPNAVGVIVMPSGHAEYLNSLDRWYSIAVDYWFFFCTCMRSFLFIHLAFYPHVHLRAWSPSHLIDTYIHTYTTRTHIGFFLCLSSIHMYHESCTSDLIPFTPFGYMYITYLPALSWIVLSSHVPTKQPTVLRSFVTYTLNILSSTQTASSRSLTD